MLRRRLRRYQAEIIELNSLMEYAKVNARRVIVAQIIKKQAQVDRILNTYQQRGLDNLGYKPKQ